ncbi:hypothetical protein FOZ76_14645 [Verticiella sediminum]|uniref:ASCH domain-containing protein n=1 Tax=Verticiella sediminum TaxID=1247510 RepID=A0A556AIG6_9BURK|nr:hypothetical protein [Verticiella sediminum]TSH92655.1 hypothetical protein FOZ76_14645 [Verticiella sediminum]
MTTARERGILFSASMVRALLAGTKTQTRRALRHQVCDPGIFRMAGPGHCEIVNEHGVSIPGFACPYGQPGDRLWVREAHALDGERVFYRAGHVEALGSGPRVDVRWRPSIHMPRWASRITLEVTGVRVERLQSIGEADALAEGIQRPEAIRDVDVWEGAERALFNGLNQPVAQYRRLWDSINGAGAWDANPWVWVVEFRGADIAGAAA